MANPLKLDEASPLQLGALLGVSEEIANRIVATRPHATKADLEWLPPTTRDLISDDLTIEKLDLNNATVEQLVTLCGLTTSAASEIVANRPFYLSLELRHLTGIDSRAFDAITSVFGLKSLTYMDKLTGKVVDLKADISQVIVRLKSQDSESADSIATRHSLRRLSKGRGRNAYQVYRTSESEAGDGIIRKLKIDRAVDRVMPAFRSRAGAAQFIDPEFCVVQFKTDVDIEQQNIVIAGAGLTIDERHRTPGLLTLRMDSASASPMKIIDAINILNASPLVAFAEPGFVAVDDREGSSAESATTDALHTDAESAELDWNLSVLGCQQAWQVETGKDDVVIALIDSGVDIQHPALAGGCLQRRPEESWNFEDDDDPDPIDTDGHGTFIAGLLVGNGALNIRGICPGCRILPLRVPLSGASLSYARRRDAILYAINAVPPPKRLIISISWKTTGDVALIRDAISQATARGALVVCSAGNWPSDFNEPHFPSDYDDVLSIAAVGPDITPADYSFFGDRVDLCAPGGSGSTTDQQSNIRSAQVGGTMTFDFGTSFAVPHVVGAAALLLSHRANFGRDQARDALETSAKPLGQPGTGRGFVRADLALGAGTNTGQVVSDGQANQEPVTSVTGLAIVNEWTEDRLREVFSLLPITIRIIVARRPIRALDDIRSVLGLSNAQFEQIASHGTR